MQQFQCWQMRDFFKNNPPFQRRNWSFKETCCSTKNIVQWCGLSLPKFNPGSSLHSMEPYPTVKPLAKFPAASPWQRKKNQVPPSASAWKPAIHQNTPVSPFTWVISHVPMFHITQPWSVYGLLDGYYKVMSNIPKMGHLPTPAKWGGP